MAWALKKGEINEEQYRSWAQEFYELPLLETSFFQLDPDETLWQETEDLFVWNEYLFPLHSWDGTLFIGCLEPPRNLDLKESIQFVLCRQHDLIMHWHQRQNSLEKTSYGEAIEKTRVDDIEVLDFSEAANHLDQKKPQSPMDETSGIDLSTSTDFPLQLSSEQENIEAKKSPATPPPPSDLADFDQFTGQVDLALSSENSPEEDSELPEGFQSTNTDFSSLDFSNMAVLEDANSPSQNTHEQETNSASEASLPNELPQLTPHSPATDTTKLAMPAAPTIEEENNEDDDDEQYFDDSELKSVLETNLQLQAMTNIDEIAGFIFNKMSEHFDQKLLVANYRSKGFEIIRWSENWHPNEQAKTRPVEIDHPGIFQIAFKTKKPFHGPVSPNAINDQFFKNWNNSNYPRSITICPIISKNHVMAFIVGTSSGSSFDFAPLQLLENLAPQLAPVFQNLPALMAS